MTSSRIPAPELPMPAASRDGLPPSAGRLRSGSLSRSLLLFVLVGIATRLATLPDWVQNADGYYFIDGVVRYSVAELRPHFPGYPVYIWCGKLFAWLLGDAATGLRILSVLASTFCLWPIAGLTRGWALQNGASQPQADGSGLLAALAWVLAPLPWLVGTEIYSDPLGLLLSLFVLWLCFQALERPGNAIRLLPLASFLAGLMLGVRLAYLIQTLPLLYAAYRLRHTRGLVLRCSAVLTLVVSLWLGWQLLEDRGSLVPTATERLAQQISSAPKPSRLEAQFAHRPGDLFRTVLVHGLGGWSRGAPLRRLGTTVIWLALILGGLVRIARSRPRWSGGLLWLFALPYGLWLLFLFDVRFPRYALPLVAFASMLAGMGRPRLLRGQAATPVVLVSAFALVSVPLAAEHQKSAPLPSQLARFARTELDPARTVIVFAANDPLEYSFFFAREAAGISALRESAGSSIARLEAAFRERGVTVYATAPDDASPEEWAPVARFCRNQEVDARSAAELWLFRRDPGAGFDKTVPGCR